MRIAHLADIHWRGLARIDEYRRAFTKMFADLRAQKPDIIFVGGDIVHNKTQGITPELIDSLVWWFRGLADIAPVHIILGNHDGNLTNEQRQDAITPIINALGDDRLHLYKRSGVYQFAPGFNWCVFSAFDEVGWSSVVPVKDAINIALYHGSVVGSVTDMGWELDAEKDLKFFEGFDFVMLGDIHKRQFLGYRDRKPWIAYPGSSLQQDFGEDTGKGYLLWDIRTRDDFDVQFRPIPHDREFWTIEWMGDVKSTLDAAAHVPTGSRVRVRANTLIPQVETKHLMSELVMTKGASEVLFKDERTVNPNIIDAHNVVMQRDDLWDVDAQLQLFHQYLGKGTLDDAGWTAIKDMLAKYMARAKEDDVTARNVVWSLKEMKFDNTFGYGPDNFIDFRALTGITGVFGPNRIGKSSIIGTLMYGLFNVTDRGNLKNLHVINTRRGHCRVLLTLGINGRDYRLERQSVRHETRGVMHAVTSLNFFEVGSDGELELNGEQRTDTEKVVRGLLGTGEDCMLTGIATQGDMNRFIDAGSTQRDQVISKFLGLDIFERVSGYAKRDAALIDASLGDVPDRDWGALIAQEELALNLSEERLVDIEKQLRQQRSRLDEHRVELATLAGSDIITAADVDNAKHDVSRCRDALNQRRSLLNASHTKLEVKSNELMNVRDELSEVPVDELRDRLQAFLDMKALLVNAGHAHQMELSVLLEQQRSAAKLSEVPCGDQFPGCKYISDSHLDRTKIPGQTKVVEDNLKRVDEMKVALSSMEDEKIEEALRAYDTLQSRESALSLAVGQLIQDAERCTRAVTDAEQSLTAAEMLLAEYIAGATDTWDDELETLKRHVNELSVSIEMLDRQRVVEATSKGAHQVTLVKLIDERARYESLRSKHRLFELFLDAVSKRGIPSQIIQAQLPIINAEISRILHGVVDFTLQVEKDPESNSTDVFIDYGDSRRLIELGSGMEKMVSSLAIRVALQNASTLSRPDFLVVDEGFGALDESNIDACSRLLVSLKRWFRNIIVITHVDAIKDIADDIIEITRVGKDSRVSHRPMLGPDSAPPS